MKFKVLAFIVILIISCNLKLYSISVVANPVSREDFILTFLIDFDDLLVNFIEDELVISNKIELFFFEIDGGTRTNLERVLVQDNIIEHGYFDVHFSMEKDNFNDSFKETFSFIRPFFLNKKVDSILINFVITNKLTGGKREIIRIVNLEDVLEYRDFNFYYILKKFNTEYFFLNKFVENRQLNDVFLKFFYKEVPDSIKVISNNNELAFSFDKKDHIFDEKKQLFWLLIPYSEHAEKFEAENSYDFSKIIIESEFDSNIVNYFMYKKSMLPLFQKRYSAREQLAQMRYFLNQNQYSQLQRVSTDDLQDKINLFWRKNDPNPHSLGNQLQETFYQRVIYADNNFTIPGFVQGWRSDRGKVYIRYGLPDYTSINNFPLGSYPSITWIYYSQNKTFIFYDKKGYGNYELEEKWNF